MQHGRIERLEAVPRQQQRAQVIQAIEGVQIELLDAILIQLPKAITVPLASYVSVCVCVSVC